MKKVNDLQIANVQPQGVACYLIFCEFQSGIAHKGVAYKKKCLTQLSVWKLFSQMLIHAWIKNLSYSKQIQ